jgi:hypothetical protein
VTELSAPTGGAASQPMISWQSGQAVSSSPTGNHRSRITEMHLLVIADTFQQSNPDIFIVHAFSALEGWGQ